MSIAPGPGRFALAPRRFGPLQVGAQRQLSMEALLHAFYRDRSPHTLRAYALDLEDFGRFLGRTLQVERAEALRVFFSQGAGAANELVLHYRAELGERGYATGSITRRLATLRSVARFGRLIGMVSWSLEVPGPAVERTRDTRGPSAAEASRLLTHLASLPAPHGPRDLAMVRLMLDLGLRVAEVVSLDIEDLDLADRSIWVRGKGRRSKQRLQIPGPTEAALRAWLTHRGATEGALFTRQRPLMGVGEADGRLVTRSVYKLVRDHGRAIGVRLHPHKLRHTAITLAVEQARQHDIGLDEVRQFSRHKHIQTLLTYRDETRDVQGQLATLVSTALAGPDPGRSV